MRYTIRIATMFGIPLRVHATFPAILVVLGAEGFARGGLAEALYAMALVLVVFTLVVFHEMGHSLQARRYGVVVRDIVLLPIGGMARAERIPENPRREVVIAVSGPAVNIGIAALIVAFAALLRRPIGIDAGFLSDVLLVNLALAVFNLIPAFPMDGGRILRGLLATRLPYVTATRHATNVGFVIAQLFALIGFAYARLLVLPLIAVVVFVGALGEERMIRDRYLDADRSRPPPTNHPLPSVE